MGFFDKLIDGVTSGDFLAAAIPSAVGLFSGLQQNKINQSNLKTQADAQRNAEIFALQKELLKLNYGLNKGSGGGGRGGGGGGGGAPAISKAEQIAAMQNSSKRNLDAISSLIAAYQNSYK